MLIGVKAIFTLSIYMHNVLADQIEKNGKAVKGLTFIQYADLNY